MTEAYLAVAGRIRREIDDIETVAERARSIWADAEPDAGDYRVDAVVLNLHGFYAGLERIFETCNPGRSHGAGGAPLASGSA